MANDKEKKITGFQDLEVYQNSNDASVDVIKKIANKLPKEEQNDLASQIRRSSKAVPRLIAEGYAKKHQRRGFQKYLDDANGESNEMIVSLNHCKDLYNNYIDVELCNEMIDLYDKTSRQLYNLSVAWDSFKERKRNDTATDRRYGPPNRHRDDTATE